MGSEMCIRDRGRVDRENSDLLGRRMMLRKSPEHHPTNLPSGVPTFCLAQCELGVGNAWKKISAKNQGSMSSRRHQHGVEFSRLSFCGLSSVHGRASRPCRELKKSSGFEFSTSHCALVDNSSDRSSAPVAIHSECCCFIIVEKAKAMLSSSEARQRCQLHDAWQASPLYS